MLAGLLGLSIADAVKGSISPGTGFLLGFFLGFCLFSLAVIFARLMKDTVEQSLKEAQGTVVITRKKWAGEPSGSER